MWSPLGNDIARQCTCALLVVFIRFYLFVFVVYLICLPSLISISNCFRRIYYPVRSIVPIPLPIAPSPLHHPTSPHHGAVTGLLSDRLAGSKYHPADGAWLNLGLHAWEKLRRDVPHLQAAATPFW